eukprot:scaffold4779_cov116-Isochrysis_galbana.AAC.17
MLMLCWPVLPVAGLARRGGRCRARRRLRQVRTRDKSGSSGARGSRPRGECVAFRKRAQF